MENIVIETDQNNQSNQHNNSVLPKTKKALMLLEARINQSWTEDCDRTVEFSILKDVLIELKTEEKIEDFFEETEAFDHFCTKFVKETITTILRHNFIYGEGGDELCFEILTLYVDLFIKLFPVALTPSHFTLLESIKDLFDANRNFYKASYAQKQAEIDPKVIERKQMTESFYNEIKLGRRGLQFREKSIDINGTIIKTTEFLHGLKQGDQLDVLTENKGVNQVYNINNSFSLAPTAYLIITNPDHWHYNDKKVWTRGIIKEVISSTVLINCSEDTCTKIIKLSSFDYAPAGFFTPNYNWSVNLRVGDIALCYERGRLIPATIVEVEKTEVNGMPLCLYKCGFRVYLKSSFEGDCDTNKLSDKQLKSLGQRFWSDEEVRDSNGNIFIGDKEKMDETLYHYSKKLMPFDFNLCSNDTPLPEKPLSNILDSLFYADSFIKFNREAKDNNDKDDKDDEYTEGGNFNFVVARPRGFSLFFSRVVTHFCESKALDMIVNYFNKDINKKIIPEVYSTLVGVLSDVSCHLHTKYNLVLARQFTSNVINYLNSLNLEEIRTIKKESVTSLFKMLKFYKAFNYLKYFKGNIIEDTDVDLLALTFAIKMLKTPILDKRIAALKTIVELLKASKLKVITELISKSNLFEEIFGVNSHVQLINKSKELLEVLSSEKLLTNNDFELLWAATEKDKESKTVILKNLKEINKNLLIEQRQLLIGKMMQLNPVDANIDELNLLSDLINSNYQLTQDDSEVKDLVLWLLSGIFKLKNSDTEKNNTLHRRIFEFSNAISSVKTFQLEYLLKRVREGKNSLVCIRQFQYLMPQILSDEDKAMYIELIIDNLKGYVAKGIEKDGIYENYTHKQNLNFRIRFITYLISKGIWNIRDDDNVKHDKNCKEPKLAKFPNPIDFLYSILSKGEDENAEFYSFCINLIKQQSANEDNSSNANANINSEAQEVEPATDPSYPNPTNPTTDYTQNPSTTHDPHFLENRLINLFNSTILTNNEISSLSEEAFQTYTYLFFKINFINLNLNYELSEVKGQYYYNNVFLTRYPDELLHFKQMWDIILNSKFESVQSQGIKILTSLYRNIRIDHLWENGSELLLIKTVETIRENCTSLSIITKCFSILRSIIVESEMGFNESNYEVKSHYSLLKRKSFKIKVINFVRTMEDFEVELYGNTTFVELRAIVSAKAQVHVDFLEISHLNKEKSSFYEVIANTCNGLTVTQLGFTSKSELKCTMNKLESQIQEADLVRFVRKDNDEEIPLKEASKHANNVRIDITNEVRDIFIGWYRSYGQYDAETGVWKLNREDCARFIQDVTGAKESTTDSSKVAVLFKDYDKQNLGYISEEAFVEFFKLSAINAEKRKIVRENFKQMGLRNDLKKITEAFFVHDCTKQPQLIELLPRRKLSNNDELFNIIFGLVKGNNEEIRKEAYSFCSFISTSPSLMRLFTEEVDQVKEILSNAKDNVYELSYYLQIVESFLQEIEFEGVSNVNGVGGLSKKVSKETGVSCEKLNKKVSDKVTESSFDYHTWMTKFIQTKGLQVLIEITFSSLKKEQKREEEQKIILELFKLIKVFYFSALNKNNMQFNLNLSSEMSQQVLESMDFKKLSSHFISILNTTNETDLLKESFELLMGMLSNSEDQDYEYFKTNYLSEFSVIFFNGLLDSDLCLYFRDSLLMLVKVFAAKNRQCFLEFLINTFEAKFKTSFSFEKGFTADLNEAFFEVFNSLFNLYFEGKLTQPAFSPLEFITSFIDYLEALLKKSVSPSYFTSFTGLIQLLNSTCERDSQVKAKLQHSNLTTLILNRVLFYEDDLNAIKDLGVNDLVFNFKKGTSSIDETFKLACYSLLSTLITSTNENLVDFMGMNLFEAAETDDEEEEQFCPEKYKKGVPEATNKKKEGHVGLYNLGAICYLNSILQQFFMCKSFSRHFLKSSDSDVPEASKDENHFHQLQRLFSFLELSERQYFNPVYFCFSFKDWDEMPINTAIQSDSQEFISMLIDKMEESLKPTKYKYLFNSVFGGKYVSQIKCLNGCNSVRYRFEDFFTLSLEVKSFNNIYASLDAYIQEEKIDGLDCESCKKKVSINKKTMLSDLPNVLIIHLKRLYYDYEAEKNVKVNSSLEFPKNLNLKKYCVESQEQEKPSQPQPQADEIDDDSIPQQNDPSQISNHQQKDTSDIIYPRSDEYYEYHLQGITVHLGSAEAGHYYSYINTQREGVDNTPTYDPENLEHSKSWLEYNDKQIRKWDITKLEEECYGGKNTHFLKFDNIQSAYVLFYERKVKTPLKLVISEDELETLKETAAENTQSLTITTIEEPTKMQTIKDNNLMRFYGTPSYSQLKHKLRNTVFFDKEKNEYFKYESYYDVSIPDNQAIKKLYYCEILKDNNKLSKQLKISDYAFISFYSSLISTFEENYEQCVMQNNSLEGNGFKSNFVSNVLHYTSAVLAEQNNTPPIQQQIKAVLTSLHNIASKDLSVLISILLSIKENFNDKLRSLILHDSALVISYFFEFIYKLLKNLIDAYKTKVSSIEDAINIPLLRELVFPVVDLIIGLFPRVSSRMVIRNGGVIKCLSALIDTDIVFNYLCSKEIPFIFITYLIGKDSPHYADTIIKKERWDFARPTPVCSDLIIKFILKFKDNITAVTGNGIVAEVNSGTGPTTSFGLTERDNNCLNSPYFIKFILKKDKALFAELACSQMRDDKYKTQNIMMELGKMIEDVAYSDENEIIELFKVIKPLLLIDDALQLYRFCCLLGYPQIKFDVYHYNYSFPCFGYNIMADKNGKCFEFKSNFRGRNYSCLLRKLMLFSEKELFTIEFILCMMEASVDNIALLKYLKSIPVDQPLHKNLFEYGIVLINSYTKRTENDSYKKRLREVAEKLNSRMGLTVNVLPELSGFNSNWLHYNIKFEEVCYIWEKHDCYILQIDYYTSTIQYNSDLDIDFRGSISYKKVSDEDLYDEAEDSLKGLTEKEDIEQYATQEHILVVSSDIKPYLEREFFSKYIKQLKEGKTIKVVNPLKFDDYSHTLTRFVAFNSKFLIFRF